MIPIKIAYIYNNDLKIDYKYYNNNIIHNYVFQI